MKRFCVCLAWSLVGATLGLIGVALAVASLTGCQRLPAHAEGFDPAHHYEWDDPVWQAELELRQRRRHREDMSRATQSTAGPDRRSIDEVLTSALAVPIKQRPAIVVGSSFAALHEECAHARIFPIIQTATFTTYRITDVSLPDRYFTVSYQGDVITSWQTH